MYSVIDLFYISGSVIFWVLGVICFYEAIKMKFWNDFFLGVFFLTIGWLFPLLIFKNTNVENEKFIYFLISSANLGIPMSAVFLHLFLDYSISGRTSWFTQFIILFGGFINGFFMANNQIETEWISTFYGQYYTIKYTSALGQVTFTFLFILVISAFIRFIQRALKTIKQNQNRENYIQSRNFLRLMVGGLSLWICFTLLKRIWPYYLYGLDYLVVSIFYLFLLIFYLKKRELIYFLPGTLTNVILISKSGLPLVEYDFVTKKVTTKSYQQNSASSFPREMIYGASMAMELAVSEDVDQEKLKNLSFSGTEIYLYSSSSINFILFSKQFSKLYSKTLKEIGRRIEIECQAELNDMTEGYTASESFKLKVKHEFDKIY